MFCVLNFCVCIFRTIEKPDFESERSKESAEKSTKGEKIKHKGLREFLKVKDENAHPNLAFDENFEQVNSEVPSPTSANS